MYYKQRRRVVSRQYITNTRRGPYSNVLRHHKFLIARRGRGCRSVKGYCGRWKKRRTWTPPKTSPRWRLSRKQWFARGKSNHCALSKQYKIGSKNFECCWSFYPHRQYCMGSLQTRLRTDAFTQRSFYTQKLLRTDAFTHRCFYTQKLLRTKAFTHRGCYTQTS